MLPSPHVRKWQRMRLLPGEGMTPSSLCRKAFSHLDLKENHHLLEGGEPFASRHEEAGVCAEWLHAHWWGWGLVPRLWLLGTRTAGCLQGKALAWGPASSPAPPARGLGSSDADSSSGQRARSGTSALPDAEPPRLLLRWVRPDGCPSPLEGELEVASTKLIASFQQALICARHFTPNEVNDAGSDGTSGLAGLEINNSIRTGCFRVCRMLCRGSPVSCSVARLLCSQKISSNYGFDAGEGNLSGKERRGSGEMALLVFSSTWLSRETARREGGLPAGLTDRQTASLLLSGPGGLCGGTATHCEPCLGGGGCFGVHGGTLSCPERTGWQLGEGRVLLLK